MPPPLCWGYQIVFTRPTPLIFWSLVMTAAFLCKNKGVRIYDILFHSLPRIPLVVFCTSRPKEVEAAMRRAIRSFRFLSP